MVLLAAVLAWPAAAFADHGPTYRGRYTNGMLAGKTADGRQVAVMGGTHDDFPYHDPGSDYDQLAIWVHGSAPIVVTGRPALEGLTFRLGKRTARLAYERERAAFDLRLRAVRHTARYYGDPADLGDTFIELGYEPSEEAPGLVYTPYELTRLKHGTLSLRGERVELRDLHGQAEAGHIDAPTDRRFRTAYDYIAAPTLRGGRPYTYVGFDVGALHAGLDGALGTYFHETGSDEFTLEQGRAVSGNPHGAPAPFDNTGSLPGGARAVGEWDVDLGPGVLHRAFVRVRDGSRRPLLALSEAIEEDRRR